MSSLNVRDVVCFEVGLTVTDDHKKGRTFEAENAILSEMKREATQLRSNSI